MSKRSPNQDFRNSRVPNQYIQLDLQRYISDKFHLVYKW